MTGGDRSFDLAGYGGTPLADVLPVRLGVSGVRVDEAPFRPQLSPAGSAHPVTRLAGDPAENAAAWERLPALDGLNLSTGPTEDAAVLLQHPTLSAASGVPVPVLAVREVGLGRTMALAVDASWRWSFSEAATGRGNQAYLRFWKNALRWLVADPDDRRVVVRPDRENALVGEEVRLLTRVRDSGYAPVAGARVTGQVLAPDGRPTSFEGVTDATGELATSYRPVLRGAHRVEVRSGDEPGSEARTVFAASARDPELSEVVPDGAFLEALAGLYGDRGAYRRPGDRSPPLVDRRAERTVKERRETSLAKAPLGAALFGLLASGAWVLRRRGGAR
jgi:hypothetical protein